MVNIDVLLGEDLMAAGQNITVLAGAYGFSQREVSRRSGVPTATIRGITRYPIPCNANPPLFTLGRLAAVFALRTSEILLNESDVIGLLGKRPPQDKDLLQIADPVDCARCIARRCSGGLFPEPSRAFSLAICAGTLLQSRAAAGEYLKLMRDAETAVRAAAAPL